MSERDLIKEFNRVFYPDGQEPFFGVKNNRDNNNNNKCIKCLSARKSRRIKNSELIIDRKEENRIKTTYDLFVMCTDKRLVIFRDGVGVYSLRENSTAKNCAFYNSIIKGEQ